LIFLGVLPARNSAATRTITNSLNGIDLRHCVYREECWEAASSYIIKSESKDSRTIVNYNELPEMSVDEFVGAADLIVAGVDGSRNGRVWFHFEVRCPTTFNSILSVESPDVLTKT
jgi:ketohexokinase